MINPIYTRDMIISAASSGENAERRKIMVIDR